MKTEQITIFARTDPYSKAYKSTQIEAYTDPAFPGLAVHRGISYQHDLWYVTHMQSGWLIHGINFDKRRQAVVYARGAAKITDWTQNAKEIMEQPHIGHKLTKVYSKAAAV